MIGSAKIYRGILVLIMAAAFAGNLPFPDGSASARKRRASRPRSERISDKKNAGPVRSVHKKWETPGRLPQVSEMPLNPVPVLRVPDRKVIDGYRSRPEFNYEMDEPRGRGMLDAALHWIWENILSHLFQEGSGTYWKIAGYVFIGATVIMVALLLFRTNLRGLFYGSQRRAIPDAEGEEDIHGIDFEGQIGRWISEGNFRMAVRLLFLRSLKIMSDEKIIDLKAEKTNRDYLGEIGPEPLRGLFGELVRHFNHVWYGMTPLDAVRFGAIRGLFDDYFMRITGAGRRWDGK